MSIQLITDSTSYIPEALIKHYGIAVIPLNVNFEDESFLDLPQDYSAFYQKLRQENYIPKSSQPAVAKVYETFEKAVKEEREIIATFLSSKMSGTYGTACMVKEQLLEDYPDAKITIIDSKTNSMQLGLIVLAGARALEAGKAYDEVVLATERAVKRTRFVFAPATLEYLKRGGRIGNASAFIGQILQVKPILTVVDGMTTTLDKVRTRKKSIQYLTNTLLTDIERLGIKHVVIHHIEAVDEAEKLKAVIMESCDIKEIHIVSIGPVIGTHVGPGAIGIAYETKDEI